MCLSMTASDSSLITVLAASPGHSAIISTWWGSGISWRHHTTPQTNGKVERYQQSLKREVNQLPYELPSQPERAIADFVDYYNHRRYHKALGDVTPADVLYGRRKQILQRRKGVRLQTINHRRDYNQGLRGIVNAA